MDPIQPIDRRHPAIPGGGPPRVERVSREDRERRQREHERERREREAAQRRDEDASDTRNHPAADDPLAGGPPSSSWSDGRPHIDVRA
jgi:hypothetical protein